MMRFLSTSIEVVSRHSSNASFKSSIDSNCRPCLYISRPSIEQIFSTGLRTGDLEVQSFTLMSLSKKYFCIHTGMARSILLLKEAPVGCFDSIKGNNVLLRVTQYLMESMSPLIYTKYGFPEADNAT